MRKKYASGIVLILTVLAMSLLLFFIAVSMVEPYMDYKGYNRIVNVFKGHEQINHNTILIMGSSNAREGIDCLLVESISNSSCLNFALSGDDMIRMLSQLDLVLKSRPKAVVLGVVHYYFSDNYKIHDDQYALVSNFIDIPPSDSRFEYFDEHTHELLNMKFFARQFYKRKFVVEFIFDFLSFPIRKQNPFEFLSGNAKYQNNLKNITLYTEEDNILPEDLEKSLSKKNNQFLVWMNNYSIEHNMKKEAYEYFTQSIVDAGIPLVVINMPLNPILDKFLDKEKNEHFRSYVKQTANKVGYTYLDYQYVYEPDMFRDSTHLTSEGKTRFTTTLVNDLEGVV